MSWVSIGRWRCSVLPSRCCLPMSLVIPGRPSQPRWMYRRMLLPMPLVMVVLLSPTSISTSTCGRWTWQIVGCWIGCFTAKSKGEPCCGFSLSYSSVLGLRRCFASSSACRCLFSSHASRISVRISPSVLPVTLDAARMLNRSRSCRISPLMYRFLLVFVFSQSSSSLSMATPMRFWVRPFPRLLYLYFPVGSVMSLCSWCQLVGLACSFYPYFFCLSRSLPIRPARLHLLNG